MPFPGILHHKNIDRPKSDFRTFCPCKREIFMLGLKG
ncbi:hypothetical protein [Enterobacter phage vB_ExiM_F5M1E]|nr:hypothetical protein [Enterobacter phage vB_ExiM_F1M1E]UNA03106.1 hypothetical protein [Enterobacter phage vB_ExiM_F2M1E]UNA03427.1 hypothetical protein [Enterobacter phage vB_ExiM_F4M1E]UNA03748.1 hypothetical protein [Enterobacter phage vB_ExiM_F5M1E]UNA04068.1 hypothetical protein [Pantoea phage vB_PdiM_F5M2A]